MKKKIDIDELLKAGIINPETAEKIQEYYSPSSGSTHNRLLLIFAILGALFIGLGAILLMAHNWDELSPFSKISITLIPLIGSQLLCAYVLYKKYDNEAWRESAGIFLCLFLGAFLAVIDQTYHSATGMDSYLLKWLLLMLPAIYLIRSSLASIIYIILVTIYGICTYNSSGTYCLLMLSILPYYLYMLRYFKRKNIIAVYNWLIPLSISIMLGSFLHRGSLYVWIAYMGLFALFYLIGKRPFFGKSIFTNGFRSYGAIGTISILFILSNSFIWKITYRMNITPFKDSLFTQNFNVPILITLAALALLVFDWIKFPLKRKDPLQYVFIAGLVVFTLGHLLSIEVLLINLLILILGCYYIFQGIQKHSLSSTNIGLSIVTFLIVLRFFDLKLSFVTRGLFFIITGILFLTINYFLIKRLRNNKREIVE